MLDLTKYLEAGETTVSNLLFKYYKKLDITDKEFLFYLQLLSYQQQGNNFPDLIEISVIMSEETDVIFHLMQGLVAKKVVKIVTTKDQEGKTQDVYDLTLIFERIHQLEKNQEVKAEQQKEYFNVQELYQLFEKEFGRPLSPIEMETIGLWLEEDEYSVDLIRLALREAVLNQAYSLKYIDRILLAWERKNLRTKEQVMQDQRKRKRAMLEKEILQTPSESEDLPVVPLYNWLDPQNNQ